MLGLFKNKKNCHCSNNGSEKIKLTIGLFIDGENITDELEFSANTGVTLLDLLECVDNSGKYPRNYFKRLSKDGSVTLLINGEGFTFPDDRKITLKNGDEVTIISSVAGG